MPVPLLVQRSVGSYEFLRKDISINAPLLHGTAIESVIAMLDTGMLPPATPASIPNHIFFAPTKGRAPKSRVYANRFEWNFDRALDEVTNYAKLNAEYKYVGAWLSRELGVPFAQTSSAAMEVLFGSIDDFLKCLPKSKRKKAESYDIEEKIREANNRKGVILSARPEIMLLRTSTELDEGVAVYCPKGLPATLFDGMRVLGSEDADELHRYLRAPRH